MAISALLSGRNIAAMGLSFGLMAAPLASPAQELSGQEAAAQAAQNFRVMVMNPDSCITPAQQEIVDGLYAEAQNGEIAATLAESFQTSWGRICFADLDDYPQHVGKDATYDFNLHAVVLDDDLDPACYFPRAVQEWHHAHQARNRYFSMDPFYPSEQVLYLKDIEADAHTIELLASYEVDIANGADIAGGEGYLACARDNAFVADALPVITAAYAADPDSVVTEETAGQVYEAIYDNPLFSIAYGLTIFVGYSGSDYGDSAQNGYRPQLISYNDEKPEDFTAGMGQLHFDRDYRP